MEQMNWHSAALERMDMKTMIERAGLASAPQIETSRVPCIEHATWEAGDCCHQGDLIFICLGSKPKKLTARNDRQLAEGDTKGSRHIVVDGVVYTGEASELVALVKKATNGRVIVNSETYIGPVFAGPCTIEHPEHQHHSFPMDTYSCVVFQRNVDAEERERRAQD